MTIPEVAATYGVTVYTVKHAIARCQIPVTRNGRFVEIDEADARAWAEQRQDRRRAHPWRCSGKFTVEAFA